MKPCRGIQYLFSFPKNKFMLRKIELKLALNIQLLCQQQKKKEKKKNAYEIDFIDRIFNWLERYWSIICPQGLCWWPSTPMSSWPSTARRWSTPTVGRTWGTWTPTYSRWQRRRISRWPGRSWVTHTHTHTHTPPGCWTLWSFIFLVIFVKMIKACGT